MTGEKKDTSMTEVVLCPVCGQPKKKTFKLFDQTFTVDCQCECDEWEDAEDIDFENMENKWKTQRSKH